MEFGVCPTGLHLTSSFLSASPFLSEDSVLSLRTGFGI